MVYFSGIASFSGTSIPVEEQLFLEALEDRFPGAVVVTNLFPYSSRSTGLTEHNLWAGLWKRVEAHRQTSRNDPFALLINARNIFPTVLSAGGKLGQAFNRAIARKVLASLTCAGFDWTQPANLTLIGLSGGSQIAIGAAEYLRRWTKATIRLFSLGGVFSSHPGIGALARLFHFQGSEDWVHRLGHYFSPARVSGWARSHWARAVQEGRVLIVPLDDCTHRNPGNYVDTQKLLPDGQTVGLRTIGCIRTLLAAEGVDGAAIGSQ